MSPEHRPTPEQEPIPHSPRDIVLHEMAENGWGNRTYEVGAATITEVIIEPAELESVVQAFEEEIERHGLTDPAELIGEWTVVRSGQEWSVMPGAYWPDAARWRGHEGGDA